MRFRGLSGKTKDNQQHVSMPVYGADPIGTQMVRQIENSYVWTYGWQTNNPPPAWKPQGERENKSSDLYPALQNYVGAAYLSKASKQFGIQTLGRAQPEPITELEAVLNAYDRLGRPGNPVFVGGG